MKKAQTKWRQLLDFCRKEKTNLLLAVIPLLLSFFLLVGYVWPRYERWQENRALLAQKQALLESYREKLKRINPPSTSKEEIEQYLFKGRDPYVVVSEVQKKFAEVKEITVRSFRILSQKPFRANIKKIEVSFDLEGDIKGLAEVLEILENFEKAVKINYLVVSRLSRHGRTILRVNLRLEALFAETS